MFKRKDSQDPEKRFKLGACLGKGAFASVYKATDKKTKQPCAIKKMSMTNTMVGYDPQTEYNIGTAIVHENIVKTLDCFQTEKFLYIQLELVDGGDLFSQLDPSGPGISEEKSQRFALELARGIEYLHQNEVVHCDIKPENTLVHLGHIKICDFGLAGYINTERMGSATGTGAYMAPELINRKSQTPYYLNPSHDVWSFGIVMYAILFADLPWEKARLRDQDFALFCTNGGVSSQLYPFNLVSKEMRALMGAVLNFKGSRRPSMSSVVRHLKKGFSWFRGGKKERILSFGLRMLDEHELIEEGMHRTLADADKASVASSSSLPSMHDAVMPSSNPALVAKTKQTKKMEAGPPQRKHQSPKLSNRALSLNQNMASLNIL